MLEEDITTDYQKKKEKSLNISQRNNDVKLKRWGREQDRKILIIKEIKPKYIL